MSETFDASTCLTSPVARRTRAGQANKLQLTSVKSDVLHVFNDEGTLTEFYDKYSGVDYDIAPSGVPFGEVKNVPGCTTGDDCYSISNELDSTFSSTILRDKFKRSLRKGDGSGFDVRAECKLTLNKEWFNVKECTELLGKKMFSRSPPPKKVSYLKLVNCGRGIVPKVRMNLALQRWILIQASYHGLEFLELKNKDGSLVLPKHRFPHHHLEMFFNGTIEGREWDIVSGKQGDWDTAKDTWRSIWDGGADENTFLAVQCGRWIVKYDKKAWSVRLFDENRGTWLNRVSLTFQKQDLMKVYEVFFFLLLSYFCTRY